jgi:hypothetical protein
MSGGMGYDGAYLVRTTLYILSVLLFVLEGGVDSDLYHWTVRCCAVLRQSNIFLRALDNFLSWLCLLSVLSPV